jgi:hypothetical protein
MSIASHQRELSGCRTMRFGGVVLQNITGLRGPPFGDVVAVGAAGACGVVGVLRGRLRDEPEGSGAASVGSAPCCDGSAPCCDGSCTGSADFTGAGVGSIGAATLVTVADGDAGVSDVVDSTNTVRNTKIPAPMRTTGIARSRSHPDPLRSPGAFAGNASLGAGALPGPTLTGGAGIGCAGSTLEGIVGGPMSLARVVDAPT